jgi:hypothetical protein
MDRHGPIHVGEGQAVALIGEDLGGVRWRTRDKAAHGDRRLTLGAAPNEAIRVYMVDRLLLQPVTSPIFLIVSSFSLFAIIVKRASDQQQKNARMERERLKRRI